METATSLVGVRAFWGISSNYRYCWLLDWSDGNVNNNNLNNNNYVRAFAECLSNVKVTLGL